jgi:hypothetical protein
MSFPHLGGVLKLGFTSSFVYISQSVALRFVTLGLDENPQENLGVVLVLFVSNT